MILGKIIGKVSTTEFSFQVERESRKFEYVQVYHKIHGYVLCQIIELTKDKDRELAQCTVIGYKEKDGAIRALSTTFDISAEVLKAEDSFIAGVLKLEGEKGAYIGKLEGRDIDIHLDLNRLLTKHVAILAKTGAGKSYASGVLMEEIIEKGIPLLIIDPHGEYGEMRFPNEKDDLREFKIKAKGYKAQIQEYGNIEIIERCKPLLLKDEFTPYEILHLLPVKLTSSQEALLYTVMKGYNHISLKLLMDKLQHEESQQKWNILSLLDYLQSMQIFSDFGVQYEELIQPKKCSIINLKGIDPEMQEIIVYKLLKDLFEDRKKGKLPPFFCVLEEAHNFVPERNFGEKISSSIIRTVASEGRKFGMGLCVISQRPARIEKNVLSQCNTQIILKVTNPSDLRAISNSVEGMVAEGEAEIKGLPVGNAMITGVVDVPLFVRIRPRKSKHGGEAVEIFDLDVQDEVKKYEEKEILPVLCSKFTKKDLLLMHGKVKVTTYLIPAAIVTVGEERIPVLIELVRGNVVKDITTNKTVKLQDAGALKSYAFYGKIEYKQEEYDRKMRAVMKIEQIRKNLEKMVVVHDLTPCFIVYHHAK